MLRVVIVIIISSLFVISDCTALSHCKSTDIPVELLRDNAINLVYTMEGSCKMCEQQALRLPRLKRYLEKKGIKTHMIVGVSKGSERLSGLVPNILVNDRHVWRALGEHNNTFYVIDRCGRMVFEIINPWSNLRLPFVRSAIIAAQHSHLCGLCPTDYTHTLKVEEIAEYPEHRESHEYIPEDVFPLKMTVKKRHMHKSNPKIYDHIVRIPDLPKYHGHLSNDGHIPDKKHYFKLKEQIEESVEAKSSTAVPTFEKSTESQYSTTDSINLELSTANHYLTGSVLSKVSPSGQTTSSGIGSGSEKILTTTSRTANTEEVNIGSRKESNPLQQPHPQYLTVDQHARRQQVLNHYKHILDKIKLTNDYDDLVS